jgi:hypothetical protein
MKNMGRNTLGMLGIAAVTMLATLAFMGPNPAQAGEDASSVAELAKVTPEISTPKLEADKCVVTLKADKETYTQGDKPVFTIEVKNDSDKEVTKSIKVAMFARDLQSRSRMPSVAVEVWAETREITVAAGETRTVTVESDTEVSVGSANTFRMFDSGEVVSREAKTKAVAARKNIN